MTINNTKTFESTKENVWKYVFEIPNGITESVLYRYNTFEERTVICCSVQSGCPVGCTFCGTGRRFLKNLSSQEITEQINYVIKDKEINTSKIKKFQIMFMSMGEPFLNYENVEKAIKKLNKKYPNAQLLVSTIAPNVPEELSKFIKISKKIDKVGLQFSIHKSTDKERDKLIFFKNKLTLKEIADYGIKWLKATGRKPFCNYCVDGRNNSNSDFKNLNEIFRPEAFNFTFSVVCAKDEKMREIAFRDLNKINQFKKKFIRANYDTRTFDPEGQDDIGGGCGQLWYVQNFLKKLKEAKYEIH